MNWVDTVSDAIDYIENNICNENLSIDKISDHCHISSTHLTRCFTILTGFSISEYIRNRRLSIAGELLKSENNNVLSVAYEVGYATPEAFTKSFKRYYNITPVESRKLDLPRFNPLQIKLILTQEEPLVPKVVLLEELYLNGEMNYVPENDDLATASLWHYAIENKIIDSLKQANGFCNLVGINYQEKYSIRALTTIKNKTSIIIPKATWVIFKCRDTNISTINNTWKNIYSTWVTTNNIQLLDLPQLEVYYGDDNHCCEIWIAIK